MKRKSVLFLVSQTRFEVLALVFFSLRKYFTLCGVRPILAAIMLYMCGSNKMIPLLFVAYQFGNTNFLQSAPSTILQINYYVVINLGIVIHFRKVVLGRRFRQSNSNIFLIKTARLVLKSISVMQALWLSLFANLTTRSFLFLFLSFSFFVAPPGPS